MASMDNRIAIALVMAAMTAACATSSQLLTGTPRPPISPDDVRVYTHAPPSFEEIAILNASRESTSAEGERAFEKMIESLKARAALVGANGLLLEDFSDAQTLSLSTGVGSETYTHNGSISLGVAGWFGIAKRSAKGRAIFVPPG
jgi:hypothetical protein